jgi:two-component system LytT family response regulator
MKLFDNILACRTHAGYVQINTGSIFYCKSEGSYLYFSLDDGRIVSICRTIKAIETTLPKEDFIRIHNSLLVNLSKTTAFSSRHHLVQIKDHYFKIARRRNGIVLKELLKRKIPDIKINRLQNIITAY